MYGWYVNRQLKLEYYQVLIGIRITPYFLGKIFSVSHVNFNSLKIWEKKASNCPPRF